MLEDENICCNKKYRERIGCSEKDLRAPVNHDTQKKEFAGSARLPVQPADCFPVTTGASMKYLICRDFAGLPVPFLFPDKVAHVDMREQLPYSGVLSAGYTALRDGRFVVWGGDSELGAQAAEGDAELLTDFFTERKN